MSGHSKWNNIKRKKGAADAAKGKIFTKLGREIQVAVRMGGPDPAANSSLSDAIAKAKANNMPNESIKRSITKASSSSEGADYEPITYEGYGPEGIALMVHALTNNKNRTAGDVRHIFNKYGGNLGSNGSVTFLFETKGYFALDREEYPDEDQVMMDALEGGASDVNTEDPEAYVIYTEPGAYHGVLEYLQGKGYEFLEMRLGPVPLTTVAIKSQENINQMEAMLEAFEDNDDVQDVFDNWSRTPGEA